MFSPNLLTATALVVTLTACGNANTAAPKTAEIPKTELSIIATHDFDTDFAVTSAAFSPNDIASWLGAVALLSDDGAFYTTNIEGARPKRLDTEITDVIGISRTQEPAAFLALSTEGSLKAYIESDDDGGFSSLAISKPGNVMLSAFCRQPEGLTDTLYAITVDAELITLKLSISNNSILSLSQPSDPILSGLGTITSCLSDPALGQYLLIRSGDNKILTRHSSGKTSSLSLPVASNLTPSIALMGQPNGNAYLLVTGADQTAATLYDPAALTPLATLTLENGFSIMGLTQSANVTSTRFAYGGSAFDGGVVIFPDADANRLVVMSHAYLSEQADALLSGSATP